GIGFGVDHGRGYERGVPVRFGEELRDFGIGRGRERRGGAGPGDPRQPRRSLRPVGDLPVDLSAWIAMRRTRGDRRLRLVAAGPVTPSRFRPPRPGAGPGGGQGRFSAPPPFFFSAP